MHRNLGQNQRIEYRAIIKFLSAQQQDSHQIHNQLVITYGDDAPSYSTVYRWNREFLRGRKSLEDDPRSGRPNDAATPANINRVRKLIEEDRHLTLESIGAIANLAKGTVHSILHDHLHMQKVSARWVPRNLTNVQRLIRHDLSRELLRRYEADPDEFELRIVTCDETWLHHYEPHSKRQSMEWVGQFDPRPKKARSQSSAGKVLLTVFWDARGVILTDYLQQGHTVTGPYYANLLGQLRVAIRKKRHGLLKRGVLLLQDNASSHTSEVATRAARNHTFELLSHPPYSPDLSPCDYYLFPKLKSALRGTRYDDDEEVIDAAERWFSDQSNEFYLEGIRALWHRWTKCIHRYGDYVEKD